MTLIAFSTSLTLYSPALLLGSNPAFLHARVANLTPIPLMDVSA